MALTRAERHKIYKTLVESGLDPAQCNFEHADKALAVITHSSGSEFEARQYSGPYFGYGDSSFRIKAAY
jgi:hypothetical protein